MQTLSHASTPMQNTFPNMSLSLLSLFHLTSIHQSHSHGLFMSFSVHKHAASSLLLVTDCLTGETLLCRGRETAKHQHVTNMRGPAGSYKHVWTVQKI